MMIRLYSIYILECLDMKARLSFLQFMAVANILELLELRAYLSLKIPKIAGCYC